MGVSYAQGFMSTTPDRGYGWFMCTSGLYTRLLARLSPSGVVDTSTTYTTSSTSYAPRAAASDTGDRVWGCDGRSINYRGSIGGPTSELITTYYYFAAKVFNVYGQNILFYSGCGNSAVPCASGQLWYSTPFMITNTSGTNNRAMTGLTAVPALGDFVFASNNILYAASDSVVSGTGGLRKYTNVAGTLAGSWSATAFGDGTTIRNPPGGTIGVHGLTGRTEGSEFVLYMVRSQLLWLK